MGTVFLRTVKADGVEYVQLVENSWVDGKSRTKVIYGFGRKDRLDEEAVIRLVGSLLRYVGDGKRAGLELGEGAELPFSFLRAKELGGPHLLGGLWKRLGIDKALRTELPFLVL